MAAREKASRTTRTTSDYPRYPMAGAEAGGSLPDLVRVAVWRRWFFVFPFLLGMAATLVSSLYWPRKFTASTVIEREDDVALSSIVSRSSVFGFSTRRLALPVEIQSVDAVREAAKAIGMTRMLPHDRDGELTIEGQQRLQQLVDRLRESIEISFREKSDRLDLIEVSFKWSDPKTAQQLVTKLSDNYIETTRRQIVQDMEQAKKFFEKEEKLYSDKVESAEKRLESIKVQVGGDPTKPGVLEDKIVKLMAKREQLMEKKRERDRDAARIRESITRIEELMNNATSQPTTTSAPAIMAETGQYRADLAQTLDKEILDLTNMIADMKDIGKKKDEHPDVVAAMKKRARLQEQLDEIRKQLGSATTQSAGPATTMDPGRLAWEREQRLQDLRYAEDLRTYVIEDVQNVDAEIKVLDDSKPEIVRARQEYNVVLKEYEAALAEMKQWQGWRDQVERFLKAEWEQRGIQLKVKEQAQTPLRPSQPTFLLVLFASLAIGGAVGTGFVLVAEFFDRSFRTSSHVSSGLGVPVLESIDEIMTPQVRFRRFLRRAVLTPSCLAVVAIGVGAVAWIAFLSLDRPATFDRIRAEPMVAVREWINYLRVP